MNLGDPIKHTPPLKRVDLKPPPRPVDPPPSPGLQHLADVGRQIEGERIWRLVVETSRTSAP